MFESFSQKFKNSNDITECCTVGYECSIQSDCGQYFYLQQCCFLDVKNVLFDFQLS